MLASPHDVNLSAVHRRRLEQHACQTVNVVVRKRVASREMNVWLSN